MIGVRDLQKRFEIGRDQLHALSGLSFNVESHCFFTLLGPSGCGKSTLLRCVAGLEVPDSGEITIGARRVFSSADRINLPPNQRSIGMVFQSYAIWPHMTVYQNVAFPLEVQRRDDIQKRTMNALELVGLSAMAGRYASKLSGGQQQRVAFARAIVAEPEVLLLDEPLSNLDAALREQMCIELRKMHERLRFTTLYVTHDQQEALSLSDQVAVMREGRFVEVSSPEMLWSKPRTIFAAQFLGGANIFSGEARIEAGGALVRTGFGVIWTSQPATGHVTLFVRPETVTLVENGAGPNYFSCQVISQRFLGDVRHIELQLPGDGSVLRCKTRTATLSPDRAVIAYIKPEHVEVLREETS